MADDKCASIHVIFIGLSILVLGIAVVFFITGGVFYAKQRPDEADYRGASCRVLETSIIEERCRSPHTRRSCSHPIWQVEHDGQRSTIRPDIGFISTQLAQQALDEFPVRIFSLHYATHRLATFDR